MIINNCSVIIIFSRLFVCRNRIRLRCCVFIRDYSFEGVTQRELDREEGWVSTKVPSGECDLVIKIIHSVFYDQRMI